MDTFPESSSMEKGCSIPKKMLILMIPMAPTSSKTKSATTSTSTSATTNTSETTSTSEITSTSATTSTSTTNPSEETTPLLTVIKNGASVIN